MSSQEDYKWKRFWCSREGSINFDSAGYLADPDVPYGYASNPDVVTLDSISS